MVGSNKVVPVSAERNWRILSIFAQNTTPMMKADDGAEDADAGAGDQEDPHHGAARRAHGAQDGDVAGLVLHQHDQAGNDVQRRHQDDQRQDQEHHIALDLQRFEQAWLISCQERTTRIRAGSARDRLNKRIHIVGRRHHHFETGHGIAHVEVKLRLRRAA